MSRTAVEKAAYDREYIKNNVMRIDITFNRKKEDDMELIEWLRRIDGSMVSYIKRLIRQDMGGK